MPSTTVLAPASPAEAAAAIAAEPDITVIGGGTIVIPRHMLGEVAPERALWLGRAGLDGVREDGDTIVVGSAATLARCRDLPAPVGPCAANIGDVEVQAQATIGGNICAGPPCGDLRGPLLALEATVRVAGAGGERTVGPGEFFEDTGASLVLDVSFERPEAGAFVPLRRHHTESLTAIGISAVRSAGGQVRLAATGVAPDARRLASAEAALDDGGSAADAAEAALDDCDLYDDVLASAAYRRRVLPTLIRRALEQLGG